MEKRLKVSKRLRSVPRQLQWYTQQIYELYLFIRVITLFLACHQFTLRPTPTGTNPKLKVQRVPPSFVFFWVGEERGGTRLGLDCDNIFTVQTLSFHVRTSQYIIYCCNSLRKVFWDLSCQRAVMLNAMTQEASNWKTNHRWIL